MADKMKRLDTVKIPKAYDYSCLASLSHEAKEKLTAIQPTNLAQAFELVEINPSDIAALLVQLSDRFHVEQLKHNRPRDTDP